VRLSDAIATGRVLLKPLAGELIDMNGTAGCALGMAAKAAGIESISVDIRLKWPWIREEAEMPCSCIPSCTPFASMHSPKPCFGIITHIFDDHVMTRQDWTLDQLIDWVRSVEPPEPFEDITAVEPVKVEVPA
jgi:hypothetical protein